MQQLRVCSMKTAYLQHYPALEVIMRGSGMIIARNRDMPVTAETITGISTVKKI
jgi:hypothetical protein